jgi:phosphatidylinositol alpha-1,6-mannosyltransferase
LNAIPRAGRDSAATIAFLNSWTDDPVEGSGTTVAIQQLERGLGALGHRVRVFPRRERLERSKVGRILYNIRVLSYLRRERFDAVLGFDLDGFLVPRGAVDRYLVSLKGIAADEARYERRGVRRLLRMRACLERANTSHADRTLVTSEYCRRVARESYGLSDDVLAVVPECIDLDAWRAMAAADPPPRDPRPTILHVAHQYPRKDTGTLLKAISLLRHEYPGVQLRLVGVGPRLRFLRKRAEELDLRGNVRFLGAIRDRLRLMQHYFEADLFCLPSRQEGFGIVFLEAMAAGLPVVAARAGAAPEVIGDGEAGLLFEPGDAVELKNRLSQLLGDAELRRALSEAARERVQRYERRHVAMAFLQALGI